MSDFLSIVMLRGRLSRIPYGLVAVPILLIYQFQHVLTSQIPNFVTWLGYGKLSQAGLPLLIIFTVLDLLVVPLFIVSFNRLHDLRLTGWLALPYLMAMAIQLYAGWTRANLVPVGPDMKHLLTYMSIGCHYYGLVLALVLLLIPARQNPAVLTPAMA